jgi:exonuclease SbcD
LPTSAGTVAGTAAWGIGTITFRLVHTSDWHLGHELNGFSRGFEHDRFLAWLTETLVARNADALLVTGDIFDKQNPASEAQRQLFGFLGRVKRRLPALDIVLIAGNHDSAGRLEAPSAILDDLGVRVIGSPGRGGDGEAAVDRLLCPLTDRDGAVRAWVAAVPFLRPADLPPPPRDSDGGDPLVWGVGEVYRVAIEAARRRLAPGQALILTGHCYMTGGEISEFSERRILGGNQHALPASLFPADVAYVALGHLHKPQSVGGRPHVRYAGSPLPLAVNERGYAHQVVLVSLRSGMPAAIEAIRVPRAVPYWRIPETGDAVSPEEIDALLRTLPAGTDPGPEARPFLDVMVRLERPAPELRQRIEEALALQFVRLVRVKPVYPEAAAATAASGPPLPDLAELQPDQVFRMCYQEKYRRDPPADLLADFHELVDAAHREQG